MTVTVSGIIRGEEREEQAIVGRVLAKLTDDPSEKPVLIAQQSTTFSISESFLAVSLALDQSDEDSIIRSPGEEIDVKVFWQNKDDAQLQNLVITATLSGSGLDESSINSVNGYFDEVTRNIVWDRQQIDSFAAVPVGGSGELSFKFRALPDRIEFAGPQKQIQVRISAEARRVTTNRKEKVWDIALGHVALRSVLQVVGNTLYATSSLKNKGPLPPKVGERTSYVLKYFLKNSGNPLSDVQLRIPLTRPTEFAGRVAGVQSGEWRYDEETHTVLVSIPSIAPVGPLASRSVEVQVVVAPTSRDVGSHLTLTDEVTYQARDTYVDEVVKGTVPSLQNRILWNRLSGIPMPRWLSSRFRRARWCGTL